jgi:flagellar hook-length control protein FliK
MAAMPSAATGPAPAMPASRPMPDGSLEQPPPDPLPGVAVPRPEPSPVPVSLTTSAALTPALTAAVDPQAEPAALPLSAPLGSEEWQDQVVERTGWLVDQGQGRAQLRLSPPQLGVVDVQVLVDGDRASVAFSAHSSAAREALELALPRLREMLGGQGFSGVDVSVSHHSLPGRSSERQSLPAGDDAAVPRFRFENPEPPIRAVARGRFDAYA